MCDVMSAPGWVRDPRESGDPRRPGEPRRGGAVHGPAPLPHPITEFPAAAEGTAVEWEPLPPIPKSGQGYRPVHPTRGGPPSRPPSQAEQADAKAPDRTSRDNS